MTRMVTVRNARINGKNLAGDFALVNEQDDKVVIRVPDVGAVKLPRALTNLPPKQSYTDLLKEIESRFDVLSRLMDGVVNKKVRSIIVSGAPGVGKTYTIEAKLSAAKASGMIKKFTVVRGTISPIGLYILLYEHRHSGNVIVLDDSDSIFMDETGANLIKAATDSSRIRHVSYYKEAAALELNGVPKTFEYGGAICVATNLDFEREVAMKSKVAVHLSAILNRALYVDLGLHSQASLMARVESVCKNTNMLKDEGLTDQQIGEVVAWMRDNQTKLRSLSLRTANQLASLIVTDESRWREVAKVTLLRASGR